MHVSPESGIPDSPFGVVRTGDEIEFRLEDRKLELLITEQELQARIKIRKDALMNTKNGEQQSQWLQRQTRRGYRGLYERTVNQSHQGADFDFLTATGV